MYTMSCITCTHTHARTHTHTPHPGTTLPPGVEWSQTHALYEDTLLHGFTPLVKTHQSLHFETTAYPEILEQVSLYTNTHITFTFGQSSLVLSGL